MKKGFGQLLFLAAIPLAAEEPLELDRLTVEDGAKRYEAPSDTFEVPDYLKSDSYLEKAPAVRSAACRPSGWCS